LKKLIAIGNKVAIDNLNNVLNIGKIGNKNDDINNSSGKKRVRNNLSNMFQIFNNGEFGETAERVIAE
jgi:hypothetical protein